MKTAPNHYLNQCWHIISKIQWHSIWSQRVLSKGDLKIPMSKTSAFSTSHQDLPGTIELTRESPNGNQGTDSIKTCHLTSIGNPIVVIRWSYHRLISTTGFPILVRWHLYIESGPSLQSTSASMKSSGRLSRPCSRWSLEDTKVDGVHPTNIT